MPKKVLPLTDTELKKSKIQEKTYRLTDGAGLYLLVEPNGSKGWRLDYTRPNGGRNTISLGTYPTITLCEAREKRDELKKQIKKGVDPSLERKGVKELQREEKEADHAEEERKQNTFEKVARDFFESITIELVPKYHSSKLARLENHIFPYMGNIPIDQVSRLMIIEHLERLKAANKIETARRILNIIEQVYRYAVTHELAPHNIIADIDKRYVIGKKEVRHFPTITDPVEIGKLVRMIDEYPGDISTKYALKLAILTAQRPYNIRFAEWNEFDLERDVWQISAEKMKMKRPHIIPIILQIKTILRELEPFTKNRSQYLFPALTSNVRPISENTMNQALRRLGYTKEEIVSHGFRAMFSTIANEHIPEHGFHSDIIERHLAHSEQNKTKGAYNRAEYLNERRGLIEWWANFLDKVRMNKP
ncbi:tyrosine-type recombinase/integrase [Sulfurospirillum deleyianum]|uniref:Integrase family protein n=1 Tax=Sulfurospirillum deleyianum (strain ATCC 51133 / DSM 6946 / 5175) TaxID=525898 RepID=D1B120_SULD5|nr:integrase arm-type DNA-binding domain-containing protein [Sulfurospirillum deleyianum]ACZ11790.1 integrase family protein [Sulfurospirillum deleyianum DSM 6946]